MLVAWRSVSKVKDKAAIGGLQSVREDPEDEPVSELSVSRPLRSRKRPPWWKDMYGSDCE